MKSSYQGPDGKAIGKSDKLATFDWAAVAAQLNPPEQPEDTVSIGQYAVLAKIADSTALRQLEDLVTSGRAEKVWCRILNKRGKRIPGNAYRLLGVAPTRASKRTR